MWKLQYRAIGQAVSNRSLIAKGQTWFDGFGDKILSLYVRGMTVREIQGHVAEPYGTDVSPTSSAGSPTRSLTRFGSGRTGRSTRSIRWCFWTLCGPEAITSVFPQAVVQTRIVHLIRDSLAFVSWKDRKAILPAIKAIYRAENWRWSGSRSSRPNGGKRYPAIGPAWRRAWEHVVPFFAFAPGIRKMIYTTNAVEALNRSLRKIIKTRGSFPNDDAALKLLSLAIRNAGMRWRRSTVWTAAMGHSVRRAFSGIGAMIRPAQTCETIGRPMSREHINCQTRCSRPASPVKVGLRPPPSAAKGLDRARCPALVATKRSTVGSS